MRDFNSSEARATREQLDDVLEATTEYSLAHLLKTQFIPPGDPYR